MITILVVTVPYNKTSAGGAAKSFLNIFNGLKEIDILQLEILELKTNKMISRFLNPLGLGYFVFIPKILKRINKFKPNIIITQSRISFSAIFSASIKKIPIINVVRDNSDICPKHIDIIGYGKACPGLRNKKTCYSCINYWRTLRVLIGNKSPGWEYTLTSYFSTITYKIRYFACRINLSLRKKASINLVASELMKKILSNTIDSKKIKIANITPIKKISSLKTLEKKEQLLFIIPNYNASHKGLDFILKLTQIIPKNYKILIVGNKLSKKQLAIGNQSNIVNLDQVGPEELNRLYRESKITLVPSFYNEAFGRIIIESLVNKTPVISSPNCGANAFFIEKQFLKIVPLKLSLWLEAINDLVKKSHEITDNQIKEIYNQFSIQKSIDDILMLIKQILSKRNE